LKNEQNKTILLSSHQLSEIELIANRMVIINKGKSIVEGEVQDLLNAQELVVHLEVDAVAKSKQVISTHFSNAQFVGETANELEVAIEKSQVPNLNKALIENGVLVFALEPKRKLEDFFMKIVQS
jgi:ABC-type multidrug transport system ATPase subunit